VSVIVIPTGVVFPDGLFVEVVEDGLPHPVMKRPTTTINRARVILRIFASKFKNLETVKGSLLSSFSPEAGRIRESL
jgi:hypothetical protein